MCDREFEFIAPNRESRCTYGRSDADPHFHYKSPDCQKVMDSILHRVGNTPMVHLKNLPADHNLRCKVLAKCEFFNPGGSVKDRIALRMIEDAERKGLLKPGDIIIEPTSGE